MDPAETRLRCAQLLAEVSARFVHLAPSNVDGEIQKALAELGETLGLDVIGTLQRSGSGNRIRVSHLWGTDDALRDGELFQAEFKADAEFAAGESERDLSDETGAAHALCTAVGIAACTVVPMASDDETVGALFGGRGIDDRDPTRQALVLDCLRRTGEVLAHALTRKRRGERVHEEARGLRQRNARLEEENAALRAQLCDAHDFEEIVGTSNPWIQTLQRVDEVARTKTTVLIHGESGTGKGLIARAIHRRSERSARPLVRVDCSSLPPEALQDELFGDGDTGRLRLAHKGTIFLDCVDAMGVNCQARLLRWLRTGQYGRPGEGRARKLDVRVLAATRLEPARLIEEGEFHPDLLSRLGGFTIELAPLRHRVDDISLLVWHFIEKHGRRLGKKVEGVSVDDVFVFGPRPAASSTAPPKSSDVERTRILGVLRSCGWRIEGADNAAERLGLKPAALRERMTRLGIRRSYLQRPSRRLGPKDDPAV
jgi:transcriptional regulator with GAF, ATPase, and Fis domain